MKMSNKLTLIIVTAFAVSLIGAAIVTAVSDIDLNFMEEKDEGKDLYKQDTEQEEVVLVEEEASMEEENPNEENQEEEK